MTTTLDISTYDGAMRLVIRERAAQCTLTLSELAHRAGMRTDYLSLCLRGGRPITVETLQKLATALDTTVQALHNKAKAACNE